MTKKELDKEIDFIHSNRTHKRLLRPLDTMRKVICEATNTYTNLSLFMNDYIHLYDKDLIEIAKKLRDKNNCDYVIANDLQNIRNGNHKALLIDKLNNINC